jgi:hypothetical protein
MTEGEDLSIWSHKPWWCQPWSILLTGSTVVTISWLLFRLWWLTMVVVLGVLLWWGLFLVLVPAAWRQEAQAAVAFREVHPRQSHVELSTEELDGARCLGRELGEQLVDECVHALFVGGERGFGDGHCDDSPVRIRAMTTVPPRTGKE